MGVDPISVAITVALAGLDQAIGSIDKFNSGAASNECKFSIGHIGKSGTNGFHTEWVTEDGDVNKNNEDLNGAGFQVDTSHEKLTGAGHLTLVRFHPYGNPCVRSITIGCGAEAIKDTGYIHIRYEHMNAAWIRQGRPRHVEIETDNQCVRFNRDAHNYGFKAVDIYASIFTCKKNDHLCLQSHLEMF